MAADKTLPLDQALAAIQERWGDRVLRAPGFVSRRESVPRVSTQFRLLDQALGIGGIPRGKITEIAGAPTSGMSTLALKVMASAQAAGDMAVSVDPARTFDPDYASMCGVELEHLLVIRPKDHAQGLDIAYDLIASGGVGALVYDLSSDQAAPPSLAKATSRLLSVLANSPCALIFLTALDRGQHPPGIPAAHAEHTSLSPYTSLRLAVEKQRWLYRRKDVRGYRTRVSILKNKLAPPGRPVEITIGFRRDAP